MPTKPFALLITWTCYGQWLPGDPRGYVSNTLTECGYRPKRNIPGTPCDRVDRATLARALQLQKQPTARLSAETARAAAESLIDAAKDRRWRLLRAALMSNHVHVLVTDCPDDGPTVRRILKGVSQAALSQHFGRPRSWWTRGGSDRYKHGESAILTARRYVAQQDRVLAEIEDNVLVLPEIPRG